MNLMHNRSKTPTETKDTSEERKNDENEMNALSELLFSQADFIVLCQILKRQFCSNACENVADFSAFDIMRFDAVLSVRPSFNPVLRTQRAIQLNVLRRLRMADI